MIVYAMIVRSKDGLPLSASTDLSDPNGVEVRKTIKRLGRQIGRMDDRCSINMNPHILHVVTSVGVSFMALCDPSYPAVLAFSFLSDLQKEFITTYDVGTISNVVRPYTFIEFDQFIQKARQKYNNPRSLTTRISLTDLSTELNLRPAQQLSLDSLTPANVLPIPTVIAGSRRYPYLDWSSTTTCILSIICTLMCLYRGISILNESTLGVLEGVNPLHGILFLMEAVGRILQLLHLLYFTRRRTAGIWIVLALCVCCNLSIYELQDTWQVFLHNAVAIATTVLLLLRHGTYKNVNYMV